MPLMNISKATWLEVIAEEKARRLAFGAVLMKDHESGKSLREIGQERRISHEQVRLLIEAVKELQESKS